MSLSRSCQNFFSNLKHIAFITWKYIPPVALVLSRVGGAVFNAQEFAEWAKKQLGNDASQSEFLKYLELSFTTGAFITATGTYYVTRFLNLLRRYAKEHPEKVTYVSNSLSRDSSESNIPLLEESKSENRLEYSKIYQAGMRTMQFSAAGYFLGNVGSSANGVDSLEKLATQWFPFQDYSTCQINNHYDWLIKSGLIFLECYANGASVLTYNYKRLTHYFPKLFSEAGYKKLTAWDMVKTTIGSGLNSIIVYKSANRLQDLWTNQFFCHLGGFLPVIIPNSIKRPISIGLAVANFGVTSLMTSGAILAHKEEHTELEEQKNESKSEFGCYDKPIKTIIIINAIYTSLALFSFTLSLLNGEDENANYSTWSIIVSCLAGVIGGLNTVYLDMEGYRVENQKRRSEREATDNIVRDNKLEIVVEDTKSTDIPLAEMKQADNKLTSHSIFKKDRKRTKKKSAPIDDNDIEGLSTSPRV